VHGSPVEKPAYIVLVGYGALVAGAQWIPGLCTWTSRTDVSYGLYIYAWPVQLMLLHRWPLMSLSTLIFLSLAGALALAAMSWRYVEKPALSLKRRTDRSRPIAARVA
jgi:peptidoglycan/LPS O-acetylase OafA/YrhL